MKWLWREKRATWLAITAFGAVLATLTVSVAWSADPDALWKIVHDRCAPHQQQAGDPQPCAAIDLDHGVALLKDLVGVAQFLLIPTTRIAGVESPELLTPGATNYWDYAWADRHYVEERLHQTLSRDRLGLAVNSTQGRSQNQLHIHIDCIRADVRDALRQHEAAILPTWSPFPVTLSGHTYAAMRIQAAELGRTDPFVLVADTLPGARDAMPLQTLVLTGAVFKDGTDGFYLLDDHADLASGDPGSGEELLDHDCAVAK
ncbi:MAG TPA: CDP-diacylglycerol diphosphatase [Stellaceae bacterium]|nr:CDP-diacylglycerol diphosphatase [Stellaceae bacterium]